MAESIPSDSTAGSTPLSASDAGTIVYQPRRADEALQRRLVWFDRSGKELRRLDDREPINASSFALSRDGRHLAVERQGSIWTLDAARGQLVRLTSGQGILPLWSFDGEHVVFQSRREGICNLYQVSLTGGNEELLLATPGSKAAQDWSPDGRLLLYRDLDPRTGMDLWVLPVERDLSSRRLRPAAGQKAEPVANGSARELGGQFSPDGLWLAYESDESGRSEIYLRPFGRPGRPERVSTNGAHRCDGDATDGRSAWMTA